MYVTADAHEQAAPVRVGRDEHCLPGSQQAAHSCTDDSRFTGARHPQHQRIVLRRQYPAQALLRIGPSSASPCSCQ